MASPFMLIVAMTAGDRLRVESGQDYRLLQLAGISSSRIPEAYRPL